MNVVCKNIPYMRQHLRRKLQKVRMLICDVDGVLTDGRLWISDDGKWRRYFHIKDGVGMNLLRECGYEIGVISGGKSDDVITRMAFLKVPHVYLEASDKVGPFNDVLAKTGFKEEEIAFIGDEIFDIPIFKRVGFAATVPGAVNEVKKAAHYVTETKGGEGAVREVIDFIREYGAFSKHGKKKKGAKS
jgi:3-deoxy-D-manno-octulosonate 8-phosphate phosphatase (KDO 8-P phosphatase)